MTRHVYRVDVGRVVVTGAGAARIDARELRTLVENAVAREMANCALPGGRTRRATVSVNTPALTGSSAPALAGAVAAGLARALGGGSPHG
jgi:hypothetical protein